MLTKQWTSIIQEYQSHLPNIILALGLVVIGLLLAFVLRHWIKKITVAIDRTLKHRMAAGRAMKPISSKVPMIIGRMTFWLVLFFFLASALEILGHSVVSSWSKTITEYLPNVLAALIIIFAGIILSNLARGGIQQLSDSTKHQNEVLGRLTQICIVVIAILIAVDQIGIQTNSLIILLAIVMGATAGGIALSFALGTKTVASNIVSSHYVAKRYRAGQHVRIGEVHGCIVEIGATDVTIETGDGLASIPAKHFSEEVSVRLREQ